MNVWSGKAEARNLYFKHGNWWFARQIEGKRVWVNLLTSDGAEAIRLKRQIEHSPKLRPTGTIGEDVAAFIDHKKAKQHFSRNSALTKVLIIKKFATWLPARTTSAAVTSAQCDRFYRHLQENVAETTAQSDMTSLRSFFWWAVEVKRLRLDTPVAKVELVRCDRVARAGQ